MQTIKHTVVTTAPAKEIWNLWQDVPNWNSWDHEIEYSRLDGPFETGTTGILKPKGGPKVKMQLTRVEPMHLFQDVANLPLATILVTHTLREIEGKTEVTHQIKMEGPLAFFFAFVIGRKMKKGLPGAMQALIKQAEGRA
jgi:hypothetical protein